MLWLTPAMDRLFIEGASGRRKFLDRLVLGFDANHARTSTRYETAMRERARLLKFGPRDPAWLDGLEGEMAEAGIVMAISARRDGGTSQSRARGTRGSRARFRRRNLRLTAKPIFFLPSMAKARSWPCVNAWRGRACATPKRGRTTFGPHLTDLAVRHTQKRMHARECSTGEQKALLISIVLADAWELATRRSDGHAPLLLLDEVAAHLDARRRAALFEEIVALGAQAWMTGTDLSLKMFAPMRADVDLFEVPDSQPRLA